MCDSSRWTAFCCLAFLTALWQGCSRDGAEPGIGDDPQTGVRFIAFSLREASARTKGGNKDGELMQLGGITRIAGTVCDVEGKDVIVVGLASPELPSARFDDLVVALRARMRYDEFPLVSIDPVEDTETTGLQKVRFVGHLEDTPFGKDFLQCDVLLKRYSLQKTPRIASVPSYNALLEEEIKGRAERDGSQMADVRWYDANEGAKLIQSSHGMAVERSESYHARFWFRGNEEYLGVCEPDKKRPEVFCIKELKIVVQSEGTPGAEQPPSQPAREVFAREWTEHLPELCRQHPELKKLKLLFDLVATADVIRVVHDRIEKQPYLEYLLADYEVARETTERTYKLEKLYGLGQRTDGMRHLVQLSGGIELNTEIKWLNYGKIAPLRSIVLRSRPSDDSLAWVVPLDRWQMPNAPDVDLRYPAAGSATRDEAAPGCSLLCQSVVLDAGAPGRDSTRRFFGFGAPPPPPPPPPPGGVSMRMVVTEDSIKHDESGELGRRGDAIRGSRPSSEALSWPAPRKGGS